MVEILNHVKARGGQPPESFERWQADVAPDQVARALQIIPGDILKPLSDRAAARYHMLYRDHGKVSVVSPARRAG